MRYCQKPIEVEAFQLTEDVDIIAPKWFADAVQEEKVVIDRILHDGAACVYGCIIKNRRYTAKARLDDFLILEPTGDISVCEQELFCALYQNTDGKEVRTLSRNKKCSKRLRSG